MNIYGKLLRLNHYLPIITVNINGLNSPIKRDWLNVLKTRPIYLWSTRNPSELQKYKQTKSQRFKNTIHVKEKGKRAGVNILISDKIDVNTNTIQRDR